VDAFFATHRGHGHYLAYGGPPDQLLAELMGREGALCQGRGGTQNLCYRRFFSAGIQGGSAPIATGYAWAMKRRGEDAVAVAQIGDGTLGEGTLYEAFTFAALLEAPVLFLLEYNGWAQSTNVTSTTPGDILQRVAGFGLEVGWIKDTHFAALYEKLRKVVAHVRRGKPYFQVIETRRLMAHSKGDDTRPRALIDALWKTDPLTRLLEKEHGFRERQGAVQAEVEEVVRDVSGRAALPYRELPALPVPFEENYLGCSLHSEQGKDYGRVAEELNRALHDILGKHPEVLLLGEDLLDPYGGAFKVSRGLSTAFPGQVFSTPIAEAAIVGVANGLALAGMRPVAEIMFGDFVTLATDQLINFAAKFHAMYAGKAACPVTVRLVSGGGRGYGPTHSQSLERLFCGIPGLRVVALSQRHQPGRLLSQAILNDEGPKVFVENKLLYSLRPAEKPPIDLRIVPAKARGTSYPPLCYSTCEAKGADVTLVTYGGMTGIAEQAMRRLLEEEEVAFDYIILTQLWPLDLTEILDSVGRTRKLVVVEESVPEYGIGAAVIAGVAQGLGEGIRCRAVGSRAVPIPAVRHLEDEVLPSAAKVVAAIMDLL
jgi:2-oxoisovalerate dehydrogenase E1 component